MLIVKVLERKEVIRFFGLAFTIAPFVNTLAALSLQKIENKWTLFNFYRMVGATSWFIILLSAASILIGLNMLRGSSKSWKPVLFLLGGYILWQLTNLGQNWKASKIHGLFFITNLGVFLFIADQLVYKLKVPERKKDLLPVETLQPASQNSMPAPPPIIEQKPLPKKLVRTFYTKKKILIAFEGVGPWAQLMSLSQDEIHLRAIDKSKIEFGSREIEIFLKNGFYSRTKLIRHEGLDFYFEFRSLNSKQLDLLNGWLRQQMNQAA